MSTKSTGSREHFLTLFEYAPISLWEEDYSGIQRLFEGLRRAGVRSLELHLAQHPEFVDECMRQIVVLNVNEQTLAMFGAGSKDELLAGLDRIFRDGMRHHLHSELLALWNGGLNWSGEGINYTLAGDPLDILLRWRILPGSEGTWERVLVTIENITARKQAERRFQDLFEASPISLWEEDYSAVKAYFDGLRANGVTDFEAYLETHPEAVPYSMGLIKVLNVNQKTLGLFGATSKEQLLGNLNKVFRGEMEGHFAKELLDLWNGKLAYEREGLNYSLNGDLVNVHLDFRIMPGHEHTFNWALVAIQDITARKKAEDYLRYLGTHDVMTGLYNRTFFEETIHRLDKKRRKPISMIIADLNSLKRVNDSLGHPAGDNLIRRAAEVLKANFDGERVAARIGGDEFAIILPDTDEQGASDAVQRVLALVELNNKYYRDPELSLSIGAATSKPGLALEKVISQADDAMYQDKAEYYKRNTHDHR